MYTHMACEVMQLSTPGILYSWHDAWTFPFETSFISEDFFRSSKRQSSHYDSVSCVFAVALLDTIGLETHLRGLPLSWSTLSSQLLARSVAGALSCEVREHRGHVFTKTLSTLQTLSNCASTALRASIL